MTEKQTFIQATAVSLDGAGIVMTGASGMGKSDMALRLIMDKHAVLIGDDGVYWQKNDNGIFLFPHPETKGLLEVRGLGIVSFSFAENIPLCLHVVLDEAVPERLPAREDRQKNYDGVCIPSVQVNPFHVSSMHRILLALELAKNPERLIAS